VVGANRDEHRDRQNAPALAYLHLSGVTPQIGPVPFDRSRLALPSTPPAGTGSVLVRLQLIGTRPPSSGAPAVAIFLRRDFSVRFYRETQRVKAVRQLIEFGLLFFR
jgi:hypothetical protein